MGRYRIAIVGAGPAGCTLAAILLHRNVDVNIVIYEGEEGLNARTQGGTLDLHTKTGLAALQKAGLDGKFEKLARYDGEAFRVTNKHFQSFLHFGGTQDAKSTRGRPEIDRIELRKLLIDAVPEGLIRWGHRLDRIEAARSTDGKQEYTLHFRNSNVASQSGFDLIIGADGAWSHVRKLLTDETPFYSGVSGVSFQILDPQTRCPDVHERVERGSVFCFDDQKAVMCQQLGSGHLHCSYWAVHSEDWIKQFANDDDKSNMKQACLDHVREWDHRICDFLEYADEKSATPRNLYMLPIGCRFEHKPGLTILGDAAHLMTPFAGEGANLAMADAMKLAEAIEKACSGHGIKDALDQAIHAFEEDMFVRANAAQQMTFDMMSAPFFDEGSMDSKIAKYVTAAAADEMPWIGKVVFRWLANVYFWVWKWRNPPPKGKEDL